MPFQIQKSALPVIEHLKQNGYQIISLEITHSSQPIHTFNISRKKPIALVVGNENFGVSEQILKQSEAIHIEMYGQNSSMNVVQATSIALYELTKQLL